MKTIIKTTFFSIITLYSLSGCSQTSQDFQKLSNENVSQEKIKIAKDFSDRFYAALKSGKAYEFTTDGTNEMKKSLTPDVQKNVYNQVKEKNGEYERVEYVEAWTQKSNSQYTILRYKGTFSKSNTKLEIRVVLDKENKVAGFFIKPWSDMLG